MKKTGCCNWAEPLPSSSGFIHFHIVDIESLNAEQIAALRRKCFESDVKLVEAATTLGKAPEKVRRPTLIW